MRRGTRYDESAGAGRRSARPHHHPGGCHSPRCQAGAGRPGDPLDNALRAHIAGLVERLRAARPILGEQVRQGQLKIVGARYSLETGQVEITVP